MTNKNPRAPVLQETADRKPGIEIHGHLAA